MTRRILPDAMAQALARDPRYTRSQALLAQQLQAQPQTLPEALVRGLTGVMSARQGERLTDEYGQQAQQQGEQRRRMAALLAAGDLQGAMQMAPAEDAMGLAGMSFEQQQQAATEAARAKREEEKDMRTLERDALKEEARDRREQQRQEGILRAIQARGAGGGGPTPFSQRIEYEGGLIGSYDARSGQATIVDPATGQSMSLADWAATGQPVPRLARSSLMQAEEQAAAGARGKAIGDAGAAAALDDSAAMADAGNALQAIDAFENHPGFDSYVGFGGPSTWNMAIPFIGSDRPVPGTDAAGAAELFNQIKGINFASAVQKMRGLGALSNAEGAAITAAAAALSPGIPKRDMKATLGKMRETIKRAIERREYQRIHGPTAVVPGDRDHFQAMSEAGLIGNADTGAQTPGTTGGGADMLPEVNVTAPTTGLPSQNFTIAPNATDPAALERRRQELLRKAGGQ